MIVVSDTTPLNYLVLVNAVDVLPKLFKKVYTPHEVVRELADARAPQQVRQWAQDPPDWLMVATPSSRLASTDQLDPGEANAISLAKQIKAPAVLLDEKRGRIVAQGEGLVVIRTLALLELAAERQLLELRPILELLQATSFRIDRKLIASSLARDAARNKARPGG